MMLSESPKVPYSPAERKIFRIIIAGRKETHAIATAYYGPQRPAHALRSIAVGISSLRRKVEKNREPFRVRSSKRSGPIPMSHWVEGR